MGCCILYIYCTITAKKNNEIKIAEEIRKLSDETAALTTKKLASELGEFVEELV